MSNIIVLVTVVFKTNSDSQRAVFICVMQVVLYGHSSDAYMTSHDNRIIYIDMQSEMYIPSTVLLLEELYM